MIGWHDDTFGRLYSALQVNNLLNSQERGDHQRVILIARMALASSVKTNDLTIYAYKALIEAFISKNNYEEALPWINSLFSIERKFKYLLIKAQIEIHLKRNEEALTTLAECLVKKPRNRKVHRLKEYLSASAEKPGHSWPG